VAALHAGAARDARAQPRRPGEGLEHDAVALGEAQERCELVLARVGVELEVQPHVLEADGRLLVDAERPAEVEVALGADGAAAHVELERGGDRPERHPRARGERLEQHVARAQQRAVAAGRGMQTRLGDRAPGVDAAADALAKAPARLEGDGSGVGVVAVALLERRLEAAELGRIHGPRV